MEEKNKTIKKVRIIRRKKKTLKTPKELIQESKPDEKENVDEREIMETRKKEYLSQLDEKEKMALEIAQDHLKTSFDLEKSIDFINWNNKK
jgi:hypothetical protein